MIEPLCIGATGIAVERLQRRLAVAGYVVGDPLGKFSTGTHNAVLSLQARAGLELTGQVGELEWNAAASAPERPALPEPELPEQLQFIEAGCWKRGVVRERVIWGVVHSMEAPEASTRAMRCAQHFAGLSLSMPQEKWASAHFTLDCFTAYQCVREEHIAYHAPGGNLLGLGFEHAGYARQTRAEWEDDFSRSMLILSAKLQARCCKRWGYPPIYVGPEDILDEKPGLTRHMDFTAAFKRKGGHVDPGNGFPMDYYCDRTAFELKRLA